MTNGEEIGWGGPLPPPSEYKVLPEGDAQFEVLDIKRERREMGKLGTCNVAVLTLLVAPYADGHEPQKVDTNLPLHTRTVFKLYQFFAAIGQYNHGDVEAGKPFTPDWSKVKGATGNCVIKHHEWTGKDGKKRKDAEVDAFLDADGRTRADDEPRKVGEMAF